MHRRLSLLVGATLVALLAPAAVRAQTLSGRVVDRTSGLPVGRAWVTARPLPGGRYVPGVRSGDDGRFVLAAPAGVLYRVEIALPDGSRAAADSVLSHEREEPDASVFFVPWSEAEERRAYLEHEVDEPAQLTRRVNPVYPDAVVRSGVQGQVLVQVAVDSLGVPAPGTLRTIESPDPALTRAVMEALLQWRFIPARREGRRVRQIVQIPFVFQ